MELGHILWPSDPSDSEIQRPGDPVDPVTLFYNEQQMSTYVADKRLQWMGKRFASFCHCSAFARFWKGKFWRSVIKCQWCFYDGWTDFHKNIYLYIFILGFFSKTGKTRVSHRVKMMTRWIGRERWPIDPVTQWPSSTSGVQWQEVNSWVQTGRAVCVVQCSKSTAQIYYTCSKKIIIYRLSFRKASRVCLVLCSLKWRIGAAHIVGLCGAQSNAGPKKTLKFRSTCVYRPTEKSKRKNVRLVIQTPFQKLRYYFCRINVLKIHSCFIAILNASLTINLNGIFM